MPCISFLQRERELEAFASHGIEGDDGTFAVADQKELPVRTKGDGIDRSFFGSDQEMPFRLSVCASVSDGSSILRRQREPGPRTGQGFRIGFLSSLLKSPLR